MLVENGAAERRQVGVLIEDAAGEALVSRVYDLEAGHLDSSAGTDARPATVTAFTPAGVASTWQYAPGSEFDCEGVDVGITVTDEGSIESWYGC